MCVHTYVHTYMYACIYVSLFVSITYTWCLSIDFFFKLQSIAYHENSLLKWDCIYGNLKDTALFIKWIERMHFSITEHCWAFHPALIDTLHLAVSPANMVFFSLVEISSLGLIQRQ